MHLRKPCSEALVWALLTVAFAFLPAAPARAQNHPAPVAKGQPSPVHKGVLDDLSAALADLSDRVSPAVVQVLVTSYGPIDEQGANETGVIAKQRSLGSGVIVDPDGYILTNAHVVTSAQRVRVVLTKRNQSPEGAVPAVTRTVLEAHIMGIHNESDLALLKVEAKELPFLALPENSLVRQGELVIAVGSPQGLESSVTMGMVSAVARQADPDRAMMYIQTDAPINPGNSGGPLVNAQGQLVGINTFIYSESGGSEGLGFAVPEPIAKFVYEQLRKQGHVHRTVVGASAQAITPAMAQGLGLAQDWGVLVDDVVPGGPAEAAGLKIGDIVLSVDGRPIDSLPPFESSLYLHSLREPLQVEVLRGSQKVRLSIPAHEEHDSIDRLSAMIDPEKNIVPRLGILGLNVDDKVAELLPDLRVPSGVVVVARTASRAAVEADIVPGDVIHSLNRKPITALEQLRDQMHQLKPGDAVVLQVERGGKLTFVAFEWDY
jgi:serine protease Do